MTGSLQVKNGKYYMVLNSTKPAKKSSPNSKKSYRQKKSIAKQRRQSGSLGRLK